MSTLVALSAFVTAIATLGVVIVTLKIFREQTNSYVVAYALPFRDEYGLFAATITNVGRDPAFRLTYCFKSGPVPDGISDNRLRWNDWSSIDILPGGEKIVIAIGQLATAVHVEGNYSFNISIRYENKRGKKTELEYRVSPKQIGKLSLYQPAEEKLRLAVERVAIAVEGRSA